MNNRRHWAALLCVGALAIACGQSEPQVPVLCCVSLDSSDCHCSNETVCTGSMVPQGSCSPTFGSTCCEGQNDEEGYSCSCLDSYTTNGCGHSSKVDACAPTTTGDAVSSSSSGGAAACTYKGSCGPSSNDCKCDLACLHLNVGSYLCGVSCTSDADCMNQSDPKTGVAYTGCAEGRDTATETFDGFCN